LLVLICGGCFRPFRTESRLSIAGPVLTRVTAEVEPKNNSNPLTEMPVQGPCSPAGTAKIALIDVDGLLLNQNLTGPFASGENPVDVFREKLDAAAADATVCALVLRINSPGGSVTATDIMWREMQRFRANTKKPVVACLMDLGCGGAYYLATASDKIIAHPTTITGGIGVVLNLYNLQDFLGVFSIVNQSIKAGKNIDMGDQTASLPAETKKMLQAMADEFHARFRAAVKQQRPRLNPRDDTNFDGRVFPATQALQRNLVDRIGYLDDALAAARQLAGQPQARAVMFHRPNDMARTPYATTPNQPLQAAGFPASIPGVERSRLPTFLYLWQPDPTLIRLSGQ
jgi:protease-4